MIAPRSIHKPKPTAPTLNQPQRSPNLTTETPRLIRLPDVIAKTGLCCRTIYNRFKINPSRPADYDPTFPPPIKLGVRSVAWVEAEIDRWVLSRIEATRSPNAAQEKTRHACKHMAGGIILPLG